MERTETLVGYIRDLLHERGMSMREASLRAELAPETISKILRRGDRSQPRADTLAAIAEAIGGNYPHMLELAGYFPASPESELQDVVLRRKVQRLVQLLDGLPLELQYRLADEIIVQTEAVLAMCEAVQEYATKKEQ